MKTNQEILDQLAYDLNNESIHVFVEHLKSLNLSKSNGNPESFLSFLMDLQIDNRPYLDNQKIIVTYVFRQAINQVLRTDPYIDLKEGNTAHWMDLIATNPSIWVAVTAFSNIQNMYADQIYQLLLHSYHKDGIDCRNLIKKINLSRIEFDHLLDAFNKSSNLMKEKVEYYAVVFADNTEFAFNQLVKQGFDVNALHEVACEEFADAISFLPGAQGLKEPFKASFPVAMILSKMSYLVEDMIKHIDYSAPAVCINGNTATLNELIESHPFMDDSEDIINLKSKISAFLNYKLASEISFEIKSR